MVRIACVMNIIIGTNYDWKLKRRNKKHKISKLTEQISITDLANYSGISCYFSP